MYKHIFPLRLLIIKHKLHESHEFFNSNSL